MSHFVRCDRCNTEEHVMGTINLPPGWQKICNADLCEPCCMLVRDFIRFTPADAARLPVEPVESVAPLAPVGDKLFETAPEAPCATTQIAQTERSATTQMAGNGNQKNGTTNPVESKSAQTATVPSEQIASTADASNAPNSANSSICQSECSTEERVRTRAANRRKKLAGADPPPPDAQPGTEPGAQP